MAKEAFRASKTEKKLNLKMRGSALAKRVTDAFAELQRTRVNALKEEVQRLENRERALQSRYQEFRDNQAQVAAAEEQLMEEAEVLNEEALQADGMDE
ncbi:hypothetical protein BU17DRAFT_87233 [Hysterangium stoloniferum]|nr:hypothetical protein BU17DRAFT_87233 [Hysterangium stoloniferum]